jgi:photosystem II protein PsbQ
MARYRSILSLVLVLLTTFLVSCGGPSVATPPPTYTQAQIQKIQEYVPEVQAVRDRATELQRLIQTKQWVQVRNFIHGPMAEARLSMNYITTNLLPQDRKSAREKVKSLLDHLIKIDQAAEVANYQQAVINSQAAFSDLENFLKLVPQPSTQAEAS